MALDDLQRDLGSNMGEAKRLLEADPGNPVLLHLVNTMWPYQEAILEELGEQAEQLDSVIDETGDMLQHETAGIFAAVFLLSAQVADALDKKLGPSELETRGVIAKLRELLKDASGILEEITVPPSVDDQTVDDDEDDDDDDDDQP